MPEQSSIAAPKQIDRTCCGQGVTLENSVARVLQAPIECCKHPKQGLAASVQEMIPARLLQSVCKQPGRLVAAYWASTCIPFLIELACHVVALLCRPSED